MDTLLRCHGAQTSPGVTGAVDCLVIGTLASPDWLHSSHGRKIEKALLLKRQGSGIKVVTERRLLRLLGIEAQQIAEPA